MSTVVNGFIRRDGRMLVNDLGEIVLRGWGIGNWLLPEGYMWRNEESSRFDRPRRIEAVIRELIGTTGSTAFWQAFRDRYFTRADIQRIKAQGYNSVRLPLNWRLFLADEPGITFLDEGFQRVEDVVEWCREADLYVWLDLHGAPGGQTGANIDDCIDDIPRLFTDAESFEKGLALWQELARRWADEPVVAGYDLLNEPIRPVDPDRGFTDCEHLVPELIRSYEEAIALIRQVDRNHCVAIEGHHWASNTAVFDRDYDENWVVHFHRYWMPPEDSIFDPFVEIRDRFEVPIWLGETGENSNEWCGAIAAICDRLHISYHFWPYKKMRSTSCSAEIRMPEDWAEIIAYSKRGRHPGTARAKRILDELLENILLDNCVLHDEADDAILREAVLR